MVKSRCHDCADSYLARAEEEVCRRLISGHVDPLERGRALDVGAGTSGAGKRILEGWEYQGWDAHLFPPPDGCAQADILDSATWPYDCDRLEKFDLILCKRVLCQLSDAEVSTAVANCYKLLRPGGHLLVCEPWRTEREELCKLRRLPDPESGGKGVNLLTVSTAFTRTYIADASVAPDYVLWTRYFMPALNAPGGTWFNQSYPAYDDPCRFLYPSFPPEVQDRYAFYRAKLWKKS